MSQSQDYHQGFQTVSSDVGNIWHEIWLHNLAKTMLHLSSVSAFIYLFLVQQYFLFSWIINGTTQHNVYLLRLIVSCLPQISGDKFCCFCFSPLVFHNIYFATFSGPDHWTIILLARQVSNLTWSKQAKLDIYNLSHLHSMMHPQSLTRTQQHHWNLSQSPSHCKNYLTKYRKCLTNNVRVNTVNVWSPVYLNSANTRRTRNKFSSGRFYLV